MFSPSDIVGVHVQLARKLLTKHGFTVRIVKDQNGWIKVGSTGIIPERINLVLNEIDVVTQVLEDTDASLDRNRTSS